MYGCMYVNGCTLHIIIHIDILPGDPPVGMGPTDDDVAIWYKKTLRNKCIATYVHIHMYAYNCIYVRTNVYSYVLNTYVRMYVRRYALTYIYMYVCMYMHI